MLGLRKALSYDSPEVARVVASKTESYRRFPEPVILSEPETRALFVFSRTLRAGMAVLDHGGGCGSYFYLTRHFLPHLSPRWRIVETPTMCEAGRRVSPECEFSTEISGPVEFIFSSGTLQYVPDPWAALARLLSLKPPALYLTRLGLSDGEDVSFEDTTKLLDHGPGNRTSTGIVDCDVRVRVTMLSRNRLERILWEAGYSIELQFTETHNYPRFPSVGYLAIRP